MNVTALELIKRRRRQILVHSCIYYRFSESIISDYTYDQWARQLAKLQSDFPEEAAAAPLAEEFKDFDGESVTGFSLPVHDPKIVGLAQYLIELHKEKRRASF